MGVSETDQEVVSSFSRPLHLCLIVLLGFLAYSNTFDVPLYLDDYGWIVYSPFTHSLDNIPELIKSGPRPTTMSSLALNYSLGKYSLSGYHAFNLIVHLLNGVLLYLLMETTARRAGSGNDESRAAALLASLVFVLHPVQTQGVTYIVARSGLLATACYLGGLMLFARAIEDKDQRPTSMVLLYLVCALGAGSKESFATFVAMCFLYDYAFLSGRSPRKIVEHWWAYMPGVAALAYLLYLTYIGMHMEGFKMTRAEITATPVEYLLTQFNVHMTYLRLLVAPYGLNLLYDYPIAHSLFAWPTALSFVGYALLWVAGAYMLWRGHWAGFCLLWFMLALTPDSSVIPLRPIFEHRLYLPSIGLICLLSFGLVGVLSRKGALRHVVNVALVLALVLGYVSYQRNELWRDPVAFWQDVADKSPSLALARYNLGNTYVDHAKAYDKAAESYAKVMQLDPGMHDARYNYAIMKLLYLDKPADAVPVLEGLTGYIKEYPNIYYYLGEAYSMSGQYEKAVKAFENDILNTGNFYSHIQAAKIYMDRLSRPQEALEHATKARQMDAANPEALELLNKLDSNHYR